MHAADGRPGAAADRKTKKLREPAATEGAQQHTYIYIYSTPERGYNYKEERNKNAI